MSRSSILVLGLVVSLVTFTSLRAATARAPNFIVVLVDDLDETQGSGDERAMPATKRLLRDKGVTFTNHFVTTPICCPSRVNLLRGQLSHNTNFTDVLGPHGGYAKFRALGLDREWLPTWLQRGGYNTLYTGKFIVDYTLLNCDPAPSGWTVFDALVHPFTFEYYSPAFSLNGGKPRMYPAQYSTDVVASKALALLRSAATDPAGRPFFLQVAPPAPHHSMHYEFDSSGNFISRHWYPPVPAARHWEELSDARLPRPPSFNDPWVGGKPAWLQSLARLSPANVTFLEEVHRLRLRAMRAVDEMMEGIITELAVLGVLDSTYLLFTSDNGYHEGVHRMGSGKTTAYEEDIRVPLVVAGPGLVPGSRVEATTQHIDIAPTVLALAGLPLPPSLDGSPLPLAAVSDGALPAGYVYGSPDQGPPRNQLVAEFWGVWVEESIHSHPAYPNLTWKAVRVLRADREEAYKYVLHCTGEYELYDLVRDPYERNNLLEPVEAAAAAAAATSAGRVGGARRWWAAARAAVSHQAALRRGASNRHEQPNAAADSAAASRRSLSSEATSRAFPGVGAAAAAAVGAVGARAATAARAWAETAWAMIATAATRGSLAASNGAEMAAGGDDKGDPSGGGGGVSRRRALAMARGEPGAGLTHGSLRSDYVRWLRRVRSRLDALLAVLAVCSGRACSHPFQVLHPDGGVADLWAAMDEQYDELYDSIEPFSFGQCLPYQDLDNERSVFRDAVVPECAPQGHGPGEAASLVPQRADLAGPYHAAAGGGAGREGAAACAGAAGGGGGGGGDPQQQQQQQQAGAGIDGVADGGGGAGVGVGGVGGSFRLVESDVESAAVPLPAKYLLVTDVYGNQAATDALLLA